jgi:hypothetical protein
MCELWAIAEIIYPLVSAKDCALLKAILADHSCARKPSTRARTILGLADRLGAAEVGRCAGAGGLVLQGRFAEVGVAGLLRDTSRKSRNAFVTDATVRRVAAPSCAGPLGKANR